MLPTDSSICTVSNSPIEDTSCQIEGENTVKNDINLFPEILDNERNVRIQIKGIKEEEDEGVGSPRIRALGPGKQIRMTKRDIKITFDKFEKEISEMENEEKKNRIWERYFRINLQYDDG